MAKRALKPTVTPKPPETHPANPSVKSAAAWMERMRVYRGRRERDVTMNVFVDQLEREFGARHRSLGDVIETWNQVAPSAVRASTTIASLSAGTLTLATTTSGAAFELSRALKNGLEQTFITRFPTRIRRVKVRVSGSTVD